MRPEQERTADIVRAHDCDSSRLIAILQEIQAAESYLSEENMTLVADMLYAVADPRVRLAGKK